MHDSQNFILYTCGEALYGDICATSKKYTLCDFTTMLQYRLSMALLSVGSKCYMVILFLLTLAGMIPGSTVAVINIARVTKSCKITLNINGVQLLSCSHIYYKLFNHLDNYS